MYFLFIFQTYALTEPQSTFAMHTYLFDVVMYVRFVHVQVLHVSTNAQTLYLFFGRAAPCVPSQGTL